MVVFLVPHADYERIGDRRRLPASVEVKPETKIAEAGPTNVTAPIASPTERPVPSTGQTTDIHSSVQDLPDPTR